MIPQDLEELLEILMELPVEDINYLLHVDIPDSQGVSFRERSKLPNENNNKDNCRPECSSS